jgi:hypothetical protein
LDPPSRSIKRTQIRQAKISLAHKNKNKTTPFKVQTIEKEKQQRIGNKCEFLRERVVVEREKNILVELRAWVVTEYI